MSLFFHPSAAGTRRANLVIDAAQLPALAILSIVGHGVDPAVASAVSVVEYHHSPSGQYFVTAEPAEQAFLDAGGLGATWLRTGFSFRATAPDATIDVPVCRFFGTPGVGPNEHFYTGDATECAKVRADPLWQAEGVAFRAALPVGGACAAGRAAVVRLWLPGGEAQGSRHRYLVDAIEIARMGSAGWVVEGPVFCAPA
jgi:serine protease